MNNQPAPSESFELRPNPQETKVAEGAIEFSNAILEAGMRKSHECFLEIKDHRNDTQGADILVSIHPTTEGGNSFLALTSGGPVLIDIPENFSRSPISLQSYLNGLPGNLLNLKTEIAQFVHDGTKSGYAVNEQRLDKQSAILPGMTLTYLNPKRDAAMIKYTLKESAKVAGTRKITLQDGFIDLITPDESGW